MTVPSASLDARWQTARFFVMRSPLLPLATLFDLGHIEAPHVPDDASELSSTLSADRASAVAALRHLVRTDAVVREALFVASPSLDAAVRAWLRDELDPRARGVAEIILRYVARMAARATPFGLFSGTSVGVMGSRSNLALEARGSYRRHTRLDVHYLDAACETVRQRRGWEDLRLRTSTGLYAIGKQWRLAELRTSAATGTRHYGLISLERSPHLDATIDRARSGARVEDLVRALRADDSEVEPDEAHDFLRELVASQVLVPDLAPPVTGADPLTHIIETLRRATAARAEIGALVRAEEQLHEMDADGLGLSAERYRAVNAALEPLAVPKDLDALFHVDMYKPLHANASLGPLVVSEARRAVELLTRVGQAEETGLRAFREAFGERYGTREVPFVEVLDEEIGIGYPVDPFRTGEPSPLLEGLVFPTRPPPRWARDGRREQYLARGIDDAVRRGSLEWLLSDEDVEALSEPSSERLPDAFALLGVLHAPSTEALDTGDFRLVVTGLDGPSGATYLGRFCHGDAALREQVEAHLREEEALRADAVFAEIVHLPSGRAANLVTRPRLRDWEIVYLGSGGSNDDRRIPIEDLRISVAGERVLLRSNRLGREVVPRMTSAHNHSRSTLAIYRFLAALSAQDGRTPRFSWAPWGAAPFLPRLRRGRIVLSPARWTLQRADLAPIVDCSSPADRFHALRALRTRLRVPRWAALSDHDNVLPVDFESALHVESFAQLVKNRDTVRLVELSLDSHAVQGPEGSFAHEIIVPFTRLAPTHEGAVAPLRVLPSSPIDTQRTFAPGTQWLYAKLYTGTTTADAVLREVVAPLRERARGLADRWFFLRYFDPQFHLRVRFRGDPGRLLGELLPALHELAAPLLADGRIWRVQIDTYDREVERYGGSLGIDLSERLFSIDSDAVLSFICDPTSEDGPTRCDMALCGTHQLLLDLGLSLTERLEWARRQRDRFAREFRATVEFERRLGLKFRSARRHFEALVGPAADKVALPGRAVLEVRTAAIEPVAARLREAASAGDLCQSIVDLAASHAHMHVNRVLRAKHREQELVLYDALARLYESEVARGKAQNRDVAKIA
ncbi:lantibiotic dehydratase [Pendulispora rubella]|uniref:Lantibiotic dehydratase n=1 Tax=Pendulispora rubella TaxID=2741070 RepID=A0ABZ2KTQ0_9BACT